MQQLPQQQQHSRNQSWSCNCSCSEEVATCFCTWPCNWQPATCCRIDNFARLEQAATVAVVVAAGVTVAVVNCQCSFFLLLSTFFFFSFFAVAGWFSQSLVYANCNEFPWPSLSSSSKWAFDFNRWHFHISTAICCWCRQTDRIPHPPVLLATPPLRLPFCINGLPFRFYV